MEGSNLPRRTHQDTAFVYTIIVDDIVRYIGKGRGERHLTHAINARRDAAKPHTRTKHLSPLMHRNLVKAVRAGSLIKDTIIASGLSDVEAYRIEAQIIADFHRRVAGQLWNTIDERSMDKRLLPPKWDCPAHPLYRLPRPLSNQEPARRRGEASASVPSRQSHDRLFGNPAVEKAIRHSAQRTLSSPLELACGRRWSRTNQE